jgi:hypothetical protein
MPDDNYTYQELPLPRLKVIGDQAYDATQVAVDAIQNFPNSPEAFAGSNPTTAGGGGSPTPPPLNCSDDILANTLQCNGVAFPCTSPTGSVSDVGLAVDGGSGNTAQIGTNGICEVVSGGKTCTIDVSTLPSGAVAIFRELDLCGGKTTWVLCTEPV